MGFNSVTNKAIVIEEVSQSQSASSSSGTPQPTIVVQTATPPTTTPDLKTLIADLSSALKSEAKIRMKVLEVEIPEKVKDVILTDTHFGSQSPDLSKTPKQAEHVGTANPSFEAGKGGLGRPNEEDHTVLVLGPPEKGVAEGVHETVLVLGPPKEEPILLGETGLVDSGATQALREGTQEEMCAAKHVPVTLAGDEKSTLCQSQLGTILMPHPTQPLVPMGALVEVLGCSVKWTPRF